MIDLPRLKAGVERAFPDLGPNKRQEIVRLAFEIAKREHVPPEQVLAQVALLKGGFAAIKSALQQRRFPELSARGAGVSESFSAVEIDPANAVDLGAPFKIEPKTVYIEKRAGHSRLAGRFRSVFPNSRFETIESYKDAAERSAVSVPEFNQRAEIFFLVHERFDFFKPCPCSKGVLSCGYHNANLGFGCPYECSYCFLQNYTNAPGIVLPANLDDFFAAFSSYPKNARIGSGETSDSLVFDHLTEYSPAIVDFFRAYPECTFEFKTKSANVGPLLTVKPSSNIVVGWSVNPQKVIDQEEHFTASLEQRLDAAGRCARAGYRLAFHFDPVIRYPGWEGDYADVVERIFSRVPVESIAWISLGTLRMTQRQKKMIENRFPENTILDAELLVASDGKVRYHEDVRRSIYRFLLSLLRERVHGQTRVYLCMESEAMWKDAALTAVCF